MAMQPFQVMRERKPPLRLAAASPLPMIERRRIEAEMLKQVYDTLKESHGVETAKATIAEAVRRSSKAQAEALRR